MKQIFTLIIFAGISWGVTAQTVPSSNNQHVPASNKVSVTQNTDSVLYLPEMVYDFGKIAQGKPVTHDFSFKNVGKTPFALENVQASCGCTTPEWPKEVIPAGKASRIKVGYNAAAEGVFTKTVTINYNGGQTKTITIKGEVWKTPAGSAPLNTALETLKNQQ